MKRKHYSEHRRPRRRDAAQQRGVRTARSAYALASAPRQLAVSVPTAVGRPGAHSTDGDDATEAADDESAERLDDGGRRDRRTSNSAEQTFVRTDNNFASASTLSSVALILKIALSTDIDPASVRMSVDVAVVIAGVANPAPSW
ncbi:hypothetical protein [Nocardia nepalensis]|uniref:hypothetical protein n=1 Tax=Nocardia nepalensis TaxID=3375448 RepID=UPI003B674A9D